MINLLHLGAHRGPDPRLREHGAARRATSRPAPRRSRRDPRRRHRLVGPARGRRAEDAGGGLVGAGRATVQGRRILAADIPWLRAREMWIHAVDLDAGASFADLPGPMLTRAARRRREADGARPDCPRLTLAPPTSRGRGPWGRGRDPLEVRGPAAELAAWLLGRSKGRDLRTADGGSGRRRCRHGCDRPGRFTAFAAVRAEFGLPDGFPARGARRGGRRGCCPPRRGAGPGRRHRRRAGDDRPAGRQGPRPGARASSARGAGFRVYYAIADLGAVVVPGGGAGRRGAPPRADRLPARRRRAAAPAGAVRRRRQPAARTARARRCCGRSTSTARASRCRRRAPGGGPVAGPARLRGRAGRPSTPGELHPAIAALPELGPAAPGAGGRAAGRSSWSCRSRRSCARRTAGGPCGSGAGTPVEDWNAEISLLTGIAAARIMLDAGVGVLRTLPAPGARRRGGVARRRPAAGHRLARRARRRPRCCPGCPATRRAALALRRAATTLLRGCRLHRVRPRGRRPRRPPTPGTAGIGGAVRARHRAAAAAGRPVRHGGVPGRRGRARRCRTGCAPRCPACPR